MKIYLLICCTFDGDSYKLFDNLEEATAAFEEEKESSWNNIIVLCSPKPGDSFGFGYEFYGCEVIEEWAKED